MSNHAFTKNVVTTNCSLLKILSENTPTASKSRLEEVVKEYILLLLVNYREYIVFTALD